MSGTETIVLGNVSFGPAQHIWEQQPSLRELYDTACAAIVRAECEIEELRAEVAMLREERNILTARQDPHRSDNWDIAESVREKYDEKYEGEGMDNE